MKKLIYLISLTLAVVATSLGASSCQNEDPASISNEAKAESAAHNFSLAFASSFNSFLDHPVTNPTPSRAHVVGGGGFNPGGMPKDSTKTPIFIEVNNHYLPDSLLSEQVRNIKTPRQLLDFAGRTGAQFTLENYGTHDFILQMDNEEATEAVSPMIDASKNFLHDKGFSEDEIRQMLNENNACESDLISFVIALAGTEEGENTDPFSLNIDSSIFTSVNGEEYSPQTWEKGLYCIARVVGADLFSAILDHAGAKLTKAAIKMAFKSVARAYMGPVGAVLAVAEWADCYYN